MLWTTLLWVSVGLAGACAYLFVGGAGARYFDVDKEDWDEYAFAVLLWPLLVLPIAMSLIYYPCVFVATLGDKCVEKSAKAVVAYQERRKERKNQVQYADKPTRSGKP